MKSKKEGWFRRAIIKLIIKTFWEQIELYEKSHPQGCIESSNDLKGRFMVNFKTQETYNGIPIFGNDLLPASVSSRDDGRLQIMWDNGWGCAIDHYECNFKTI